MTILHTVPEAEATGAVAELYADDIADQGYVSAHTKVMALNMEAYAAWEHLIGAVARPLGRRRYELVTLAAARGTRSAHCRLAHGRKSLDLFDEGQLIRIAADYRDADLSPAEVAMMCFAERVSEDASAMTDADSLTLREHGFSDQEILDITLAAAARNYYSRAIGALAVEVEPPSDISDELRRALVADL
ncbi:carboxymuconolactone decarboxylase family protein [Plantibacter flavus]|uniref:carboxymuconolactone decarboxylase family protein n=1 Tax=Plantibacter flavus TaxID=150123 RepID=UPI003F188F5A